MIERIMEIGDVFIDSLAIIDVFEKGSPCLYVNKKFEEVTGFSKAEVLGKDLALLQGPDTSEEVIQFIHERFKKKEACIQDILNYKKDGTPLYSRFVLLPFTNSKGKVLYLALQNDITDKLNKSRDKNLEKVQSAEICHILNNQFSILLFKIEKMIQGDYDSNLVQEVSSWLQKINEFSLEIEKNSEFENFKYL